MISDMTWLHAAAFGKREGEGRGGRLLRCLWGGAVRADHDLERPGERAIYYP